MPAEPRTARVPALAKINLSLEVLHKREDGFHDLRTVFQTISLADSLELTWTPSGHSATVDLESELHIPDNLVTRAAYAIFQETPVTGHLQVKLAKRIPMGGGLGGGSTDAAAILLALPALTGQSIQPERLHAIATALGSDVPFFLLGGTAAGFGRGTDLYPLPDFDEYAALVVAPHIHVSTPDAFRSLSRKTRSESRGESDESITMNISQSLSLRLAANRSAAEWADFCRNDFEAAVFPVHPQIEQIRHRLEQAGAQPARMTGSGASVFGVFGDEQAAAAAAGYFEGQRVYAAAFISRRRYRELWWQALKQHVEGETWPLKSRYAQ